MCTPNAPTPFRPQHCVSKAGDNDCPGAPYTEKLLTHDLTDKRACTGCACGPPANECKGKGRIAPASTTCAVPGADSFDLPTGKCGAGASVSIYLLSSVTPKCQPIAQASPTGSVAPVAPTTICCMP